MNNAVFVAESYSDEWHAARSTGFGASEAAAVCGISPWETPYEVFHRKRGILEPRPATEAMEIGLEIEPYIRKLFERRTGLITFPEDLGLFRHPQHVFVLATPDSCLLTDHKQLCEWKATRTADELGPEGTDQLPASWVCQATQQMAVMGAEVCWFGVLIGGLEFRHCRLEFNQDLWTLICNEEMHLWQAIQDNRPPDPDWTNPATAVIQAALGGLPETAPSELKPETVDLWEKYESLGADIRELQAERDEIKFHIHRQLGESHSGLLPGGKHMIRRKLIEKEPYTVAPKPYVELRKVRVK